MQTLSCSTCELRDVCDAQFCRASSRKAFCFLPLDDERRQLLPTCSELQYVDVSTDLANRLMQTHLLN
jgi:hypothetical protein